MSITPTFTILELFQSSGRIERPKKYTSLRSRNPSSKGVEFVSKIGYIGMDGKLVRNPYSVPRPTKNAN